MPTHAQEDTVQLIAVNPEALAEVLDRLRALEAKLDAVRMTPEPEWLTVQDFAKRINRSEDTVRRKVAAGEVEAKHIGGVRMIRFNPAA